jgi:hypothetical protein
MRTLFFGSGLLSAAIVIYAVGAWGGGRALGTVFLLLILGCAAIVISEVILPSAIPLFLGPGWFIAFAIWIFTVPTAMVCALLEKRLAALFGRSPEF